MLTPKVIISILYLATSSLICCRYYAETLFPFEIEDVDILLVNSQRFESIAASLMLDAFISKDIIALQIADAHIFADHEIQNIQNKTVLSVGLYLPPSEIWKVYEGSKNFGLMDSFKEYRPNLKECVETSSVLPIINTYLSSSQNLIDMCLGLGLKIPARVISQHISQNISQHIPQLIPQLIPQHISQNISQIDVALKTFMESEFSIRPSFNQKRIFFKNLLNETFLENGIKRGNDLIQLQSQYISKILANAIISRKVWLKDRKRYTIAHVNSSLFEKEIAQSLLEKVGQFIDIACVWNYNEAKNQTIFTLGATKFNLSALVAQYGGDHDTLVLDGLQPKFWQTLRIIRPRIGIAQRIRNTVKLDWNRYKDA